MTTANALKDGASETLTLKVILPDNLVRSVTFEGAMKTFVELVGL
jgi:hypothetical protein